VDVELALVVLHMWSLVVHHMWPLVVLHMSLVMLHMSQLVVPHMSWAPKQNHLLQLGQKRSHQQLGLKRNHRRRQQPLEVPRTWWAEGRREQRLASSSLWVAPRKLLGGLSKLPLGGQRT
jgi:hypothetical protein